MIEPMAGMAIRSYTILAQTDVALFSVTEGAIMISVETFGEIGPCPCTFAVDIEEMGVVEATKVAIDVQGAIHEVVMVPFALVVHFAFKRAYLERLEFRGEVKVRTGDDVEFAIVVEVENGHTAAHRFGQQFIAVTP